MLWITGWVELWLNQRVHLLRGANWWNDNLVTLRWSLINLLMSIHDHSGGELMIGLHGPIAIVVRVLHFSFYVYLLDVL